jgi:hypothetical protein
MFVNYENISRVLYITERSQESSVNVGVGWMARTREFSLLHNNQTDSELHPVTYGMDAVCSFPGGKASRA